MTISTWADSLIQVHKHQEESAKAELLEMRQAMAKIEHEIQEIAALLHKEEERQLATSVISPQILAQRSSYCSFLLQKAASFAKVLEQLKKNEIALQERLQTIAKKRMLFEGLQKRQIESVLMKMAQNEEVFLGEIAQHQFLEDASNGE